MCPGFVALFFFNSCSFPIFIAKSCVPVKIHDDLLNALILSHQWAALLSAMSFGAEKRLDYSDLVTQVVTRFDTYWVQLGLVNLDAAKFWTMIPSWPLLKPWGHQFSPFLSSCTRTNKRISWNNCFELMHTKLLNNILILKDTANKAEIKLSR